MICLGDMDLLGDIDLLNGDLDLLMDLLGEIDLRIKSRTYEAGTATITTPYGDLLLVKDLLRLHDLLTLPNLHLLLPPDGPLLDGAV